jgi:hypothetical protein
VYPIRVVVCVARTYTVGRREEYCRSWVALARTTPRSLSRVTRVPSARSPRECRVTDHRNPEFACHDRRVAGRPLVFVDDGDVLGARFFEGRVYLVDVRAGSDETRGHEVHTHLGSDTEFRPVGVGDGGEIQVDTRDVHPDPPLRWPASSPSVARRTESTHVDGYRGNSRECWRPDP